MGIHQSQLTQKSGAVGQWVTVVCTEPDGRLDGRQGAVFRLSEELGTSAEKTTDFLLTVLSEPRLVTTNGGNLFFHRLFEVGHFLREFDRPFLVAYLDLLAALAGSSSRGMEDVAEALVRNGVGFALAKLLEMDCAMNDASSATSTASTAEPPGLNTEKVLGLVLSFASNGRFASDFVGNGGARQLNAVCSRLRVAAEVQTLAVRAAAQLSAWTGFPWVMDAANSAVCGNLLMSHSPKHKDAATAIVASSLRFAESPGAWKQALEQLRSIQIVEILLANLLEAAKADATVEARLLGASGGSGTLALRRTDVPMGGSTGPLLNTLHALAELVKEADLAAVVSDRAMAVVHLLLHGAATCYEEVQACTLLLAHIVQAAQPQPVTSEVVQALLLAVGKVVLDDTEARAVLHTLGLATAPRNARAIRIQVLGSEFFLTVLGQLNHKSVAVAAEALILLEHLSADPDLLPKGPRDVLIQALVTRINQTLTGSRAWTHDEAVFFTGLWSVLYLLMFEERDAKVAVEHLDEELLDPFLVERRYQLRRALRDYIYPIIRSARRGDLRYRNAKATVLQRWYRFYAGRRSQAVYTQQLELLTTYLFDMAALEEEWYRGVMAFRRHYLMRFV